MGITNTVTSVTTIIRGLVKDRLQSDGNDPFEYTTDNKFTLSESFIDITSFTVYQNGNILSSSDYSFNADTNQITIVFVTSGMVLTSGDIIRITFNYYSKYSDSEIKGFLESSLVYFPQYRYKKTFEINSDSEIVAVNHLNPSTEELYFIANIASILIDPQNIAISVDGNFKLEATRNKSDQEQISLAFAQFKRFVGKVDFETGHNDLI